MIRTAKELSPAQTDCSGTAAVTLRLTAIPTLCGSPADIVLVLDCSGSMLEARMESMKAGAAAFVSRISAAGGGDRTASFGTGRMGLVSFRSTAAVETPLTDSVDALLSCIEGCTAGGYTGHADALRKARALFDDTSERRKIIVLFTDGGTNAGDPPAPEARAIREAGIELFCLGLCADPAVLETWASAPAEHHVRWTETPARLEECFTALAEEIACPGTPGGTVTETVHPDFKIVHVHTPDIGTVRMTGENTLSWTLPPLGTDGTETAVLSYTVLHTAATGGTKAVSDSLYRDRCGTELPFPDALLAVRCACPAFTPEPCPTPVEFSMQGCQDSALIDLEDTQLASLGRIVQLNATLRDICPDKRVALAVVLTEVGPDGTEYSRGMKTITIPAHSGTECRDVDVRCIRFVVPEDLNISSCNPGSLCSTRNFKARLMANYIDTDFTCCDDSAAIL